MTSADQGPVIAILALPEGTPLALHGLYEVFYSVGRTWSELTGEETGAVTFRPKIVARNTRPIDTAIGISIFPHEELGDADVIIVPDVSLPGDFEPAGQWAEETAWISQAYQKGAIICSVCTGSLVLAEAGLLTGECATSHWAAGDMFRQHYPKVNLVEERILATAGEADRIITSGGASSWEDLALYLIARLVGPDEAIRIAKIFLFGERSEGQLLYAAARKNKRHEDAMVAELQHWIADNYASDNPVAAMVKISGLPNRTLHRRFRAATGFAPIDYVQTLRVEEAKHMLETGDESIDEISYAVGYDDATYFRRLFRRRTGVTPSRYRQRFTRIRKLL